MTAGAALPLDWAAPWFVPYRALLEALSPDIAQGRWAACVDALNDRAADAGLRNDNDKPLRFVAADAAGGAAYETHIWTTGGVPTRCDVAGAWHDLLNAVVWLTFPRTKARLNALQAQSIAAEGIGPGRGRLRDAATLLDENGALLRTRDDVLVTDLRRSDWHALFVADRARFGAAVEVVVFGHALLDKLRSPYKSVCAHAWVLEADASDGVDLCAARSLSASMRPDAMTPLPVLGVPGWWAGNADARFYDDPRVFRAPRTDSQRASAA